MMSGRFCNCMDSVCLTLDRVIPHDVTAEKPNVSVAIALFSRRSPTTPSSSIFSMCCLVIFAHDVYNTMTDTNVAYTLRVSSHAVMPRVGCSRSVFKRTFSLLTRCLMYASTFLRRRHDVAVRRIQPIRPVIAHPESLVALKLLFNPLQRSRVRRQILKIRRRPVQHAIAREHRALLFKRETRVIRRVSRRVHRSQRRPSTAITSPSRTSTYVLAHPRSPSTRSYSPLSLRILLYAGTSAERRLSARNPPT